MTLVQTEIIDRVAVLTLRDPEHRNALSLAMADELANAVDQLESQDVGALVITGEGSAFCAGADLGVLQRAQGLELVRVYRAFGRVYQSPLPSIAAVNGAAVGAGFNLAMVADVRVASTSARFDTAFMRLAVHPGGGSTWLLRRALGVQGAVAMTFFQETLTGEDAARLGLAWRCVADDELLPAALELARRAASIPRGLAHKLRNTITRMETVDDYGPAVQIEMDEQLWSLGQPEAVAAIARRAEEIGYVESAPPPPAPGGTGLPGVPPLPPEPPKPGEPGFKLFADD
jgi:enoyl-CoA hydratase